jgi:hypothetical protein
MKKSPRPPIRKPDESEPYLLEIMSRYSEQLDYLNARKERIKRLSIVYIFLILLIGVAGLIVATQLGSDSGPLSDLLPAIFSVYAGILGASYYLQYSSVQSKIEQTVNRMRLEEKLSGASDDSKPASSDNEEYFGKLVEINVDNLSAYYEQVKIHANKSFVVSLIMSIIGFTIIIAGLVVGFYSEEQKTLIIYVSTASGIVTEVIAALFFYLYTQTVHQMKGYHDSLLYVQNILLSLRLIEGADDIDAAAKAGSINKLIEYLLKQKP